jgi:tetratricopeptide (TPR) repeat protein
MEDAGEKPVVGTVIAHDGSKVIIANEIGSLIFRSSPEPPPPPVVHLPQRPPLVIGRQAEIEALRDRLKEAGSVTYVSGLAGRGKTTLALEYAHRYQEDFESVHWLPCQGRSLVQMAGELAWQFGLQLDGELDTILRQLNDHCARWRCLLVLDDVEDETPAQLMAGGRSSVLITTRFNNLRFLRLLQPLNVPLFTEGQCFELFHKVIGEEEVERHEAEALSLIKRLGHLPIGIAVAASLIREDVRYTIAGLAKKLPADVYALLKQAVAALSPAAQRLLASMAACAPEGFRLALAAEMAGLDETSSLDALQEIHSRSLAEELDRTTRRYRVHALVREAAETSDLQRLKHAECVQVEFQDWEDSWRKCEKDMPDWQTAFSYLLRSAEDEETWTRIKELAYTGYRLTTRLGRLPEAHEICDRMTHEGNRRRDKNVLLTWYGNQAAILRAMSRLGEAMELLKKQEAICLELGNHDGLRVCWGNQAVILNAWGRLEEAMELLKKQEAICLELADQDGLQLCYTKQAGTLRSWGRLEEAMGLLKKQEAICLELGNRYGLQVCYGNQAVILRTLGHPEEAMALHKKEEAICLELGDQDGLQGCYGNQALIHQDWGSLEEAMALLKKQEAICLRLGSPDLAYCYLNWGLLMRKQGESKTATEKLNHALALFTELKMPAEIKTVQDLLEETNSNDRAAN